MSETTTKARWHVQEASSIDDVYGIERLVYGDPATNWRDGGESYRVMHPDGDNLARRFHALEDRLARYEAALRIVSKMQRGFHYIDDFLSLDDATVLEAVFASLDA